jgi:pSer/pThr/pTyr-binding forkhead associated (FHA) protein
MIKDFNSSNGTYINKNKIAPNKEYYCSIRDIISIGDEKNELIFAMEKNEKEEGMNINDFEKITETKNKNEEINQNKNKKYEENIKDNKYYKKKIFIVNSM